MQGPGKDDVLDLALVPTGREARNSRLTCWSRYAPLGFRPAMLARAWVRKAPTQDIAGASDDINRCDATLR